MWWYHLFHGTPHPYPEEGAQKPPTYFLPLSLTAARIPTAALGGIEGREMDLTMLKRPPGEDE